MAVTNSNGSIGLARLKVLGVGGGGTNAVARMFKERLDGVEYVVINTDAQHLACNEVPTRIRIGDKLTRGLGVGGNPELGKQAAEESKDLLADILRDTDMVFIAAGMGGGTGTGAAPVIAEAAKSAGALTVGIVTKPFEFEGFKRRKVADDGIARLREKVDALIVIPNDRLMDISEQKITMENAFRAAHDVLKQSIQAIGELITVTGIINLDFADVKAIMTNAGVAWMAIGSGSGQSRAEDAARAAISSPLLDYSIEGAKGVLFNVTGGSDLTLSEVHDAAHVIGRVVDPEATIIFGMASDARMEKEVKITIIATGFPAKREEDRYGDDLFSALLNNSSKELVDVDLPPFMRKRAGLRSKAKALF